MANTRKERRDAQQQLTWTYRQLSQRSTGQSMPEHDVTQIQLLRERITALGKEHLALQKQFIELQSRFRQTVKDQRRLLVESVNKTQARNSMPQNGVVVLADRPERQLASNDSLLNDLPEAYETRRSA